MGGICGFDGRSVGPAMQPITAPSYLGNSDLLCADINSADRTRKRRKSLNERRCSYASTSWFGLVATIGLATFMALRPRYGVMAWSVLFGIACLTYRPALSHPNWQGIDTQFGGAGINLPDPLSEYRNAQFIQRAALASQANVVVFPETSVHRWNSSTDLFWGPQLRLLQKRGKTLLIGADVSIPGGTAYKNVVIIRGDAATGQFQQRVPLPVAMWKPGASRQRSFESQRPRNATGRP